MERQPERPPTGLFLYLLFLNIVVLAFHIFSLRNPPGDIEPPRFFAILSRFERYKSYRKIKKLLQDFSAVLDSASAWVTTICESEPIGNSSGVESATVPKSEDITSPNTTKTVKPTNNSTDINVDSASTSECCSQRMDKIGDMFSKSCRTASDLLKGLNANVIPAVENVSDKIADSIRLEKHFEEYTSSAVGALESAICPAVDRAHEIVTKASRSGPENQQKVSNAFYSTIEVANNVSAVNNCLGDLKRYMNNRILRTMTENIGRNTEETGVRSDGKSRLADKRAHSENYPPSTKYENELDTSHVTVQEDLQKMIEIQKLLSDSLSNQEMQLGLRSIQSDDIRYLLSPAMVTEAPSPLSDEKFTARHFLRAFHDSMAQLSSSTSYLECESNVRDENKTAETVSENVQTINTSEIERKQKSVERLCSLIVKTFGFWNKLQVSSSSTPARFTALNRGKAHQNSDQQTSQSDQKWNDAEALDDVDSDSSSAEIFDQFDIPTQVTCTGSDKCQLELPLSPLPKDIREHEHHTVVDTDMVETVNENATGYIKVGDDFSVGTFEKDDLVNSERNDSNNPCAGTASCESVPCSVSSNEDVFYECKAAGGVQPINYVRQSTVQNIEELEPNSFEVKLEKLNQNEIRSAVDDVQSSSHLTTDEAEFKNLTEDISSELDAVENATSIQKNCESELAKESSVDITTSTSYITTAEDASSDWEEQ